MHTQIKDLDFTGQNIYAGIDTHKKSWKVSIYTDVIYHKTFNQPPKPEVLFHYLTKHFPNGTFLVFMRLDFVVFGFMNGYSH